MFKKQIPLFECAYRLIIVKMRLNLKNRPHRYDINTPRPRHGHKYTKHKMCLSIMMVICIKQHLEATFEAQFMKTFPLFLKCFLRTFSAFHDNMLLQLSQAIIS